MKAIALFTLAAVTSAIVLDPSTRQSSTGSPVDTVGTEKYFKVGESPSSNCPANVTYGKADKQAAIPKFDGYGLEATMNFSQITVNGEPCTGAVNDTGFLAIMSRAELQRYLKTDPLALSEEAKRKVVVAGLDTQPRKCGDFVAAKPMLYFFTQEIGVFSEALSKQNAAPVETNQVSGEKWMVIYERESQKACVYIDSQAPSLAEPFTESTPAPGAPTPAADPARPPAIEEDGAFNGTTVPTSAPQAGGGRVCFPSTATVELADGSVKTMSEVELGDLVRVSGDTYSPVFMFTHRLKDVEHDFVTVQTSSGAEIALTAGHYIYVNGNLVAAETIKIGDYLTDANGKQTTVSNVEIVSMNGLFNPQTIHGDIIVNGIRASTYTTMTTASAAHAMLAPLRGLYARTAFTTAVFEAGADNLAKAVNALLA